MDTDPSVPQRESQVLVGHSPSSQLCFSLLQRKSSKAKEKKQKRLEERAAMDAVCAKVDAANRVTLPSFPVSSSWNFNLVFNFTSFGATLWQNCVTTHPYRSLPPCRGECAKMSRRVSLAHVGREGNADSNGSGCCSLGVSSLPKEESREIFVKILHFRVETSLVKYIIFSFIPSNIDCP